jgi:hypothetical protein
MPETVSSIHSDASVDESNGALSGFVTAASMATKPASVLDQR